MYIMFPSFKPQYNKADEIYNYVNNTLKGSNLSETVKNYFDFLNKVQGNLDSEIDVEMIKDKFESLSTNQEKYDFFNENKQYVLDILFDKESKNLDIVKEIFSKFDIKVKKLSYITDETTKEGLQNKLIEAYKAVLLSEHNIKDVMSPIDIDIFKHDINDMKPSTSKSTLFHFNSVNDIDLLYDFRGGKAGVGQEANAVVDINRLGELYLKDEYIGWGHSIGDNKSETEFDREFSQELNKEDLDYYLGAIEEYYNDNGIDYDKTALTKELKKFKIGDSLTAILNGFVDIAKDPFITRGNWVTSTTNTGNLMLRAGVHPLYVSAFLAQPIISDYIEFQSSKESLLGEESGDMKFKFKQNIVLETFSDKNATIDGKTKPYNVIYKHFIKSEKSNVDNMNEQSVLKFFKIKNATDEDLVLVNKLINDIKNSHDGIFNNTDVSIENKSLKELRDQVKGGRDSNTQIAILDKFLYLQTLSKQIKNNVDLSKTDTEGLGQNIGTMYSKANLRQYLKDNEVIAAKGTLMGVETKFDNTVLSKYYNNVVGEVMNIVKSNPEIFPQGQQSVQDMFNEISYDLYSTPAFNKDLMVALEQEYYSYTMANFFNLTSQESVDLVSDLPSEFDKFRKANKGKYLIIDELQLADGNARVRQFIQMNNRQKPVDFEDKLVDSWKDLMIDNPELGEKLIKYSFITSGFKMTSTQFFTFIPNEYLASKNINGFIKDFTNEPKDDFVEQFYLNNYMNTKYVPNIFSSQVETSESKDKVKIYDTGFTLVDPGKARKYIKFISDAAAKVKGAKQGFVYKLQGYDSEGKGIYIKVNALGYKVSGTNKITEYGNKYTNKLFKGREGLTLNTTIATDLRNSIVYPIDTVNFTLENQVKPEVSNEQMFTESTVKPTEVNDTVETETVDNQPQVNSELPEKSFEDIDKENTNSRLIKEDYEIVTYDKDNKPSYQKVTEDNINNVTADNISFNEKETDFPIGYEVQLDSSSSISYDESSIEDVYNDYKVEKNIEAKESLRLFLNSKGFNIKSQEDIENSFVDPNQLDIFLSAADDFEQVKEQWLNSGRTEEDWNNMSKEARINEINCL